MLKVEQGLSGGSKDQYKQMTGLCVCVTDAIVLQDMDVDPKMTILYALALASLIHNVTAFPLCSISLPEHVLPDIPVFCVKWGTTNFLSVHSPLETSRLGRCVRSLGWLRAEGLVGTCCSFSPLSTESSTFFWIPKGNL